MLFFSRLLCLLLNDLSILVLVRDRVLIKDIYILVIIKRLVIIEVVFVYWMRIKLFIKLLF